MSNNPNIKSSKPIMIITLMVLMLSITIVFAFVGCNSRNKDEEEPENNIEEELPDPPSDKEEPPKEDEKAEEKVEEKTETPPATAPTVTTPTVTPAVTNTVKPKPTPSAPVKPKPAASSYDSITITKNGRYSETKTYNNITIKADDVRLLNKTIKGNLIIDKDVDFDEGDITLDNVIVDGEILVKGGYSIRLIDVDADTIKIRKDTGRTKLTALGKTEIKDVYTKRSITLREDDLYKNYDGFQNLTIENSSNIYVNVDLYNCDLDGLYANDRTKVKAPDKSVEINVVKAYDAVALGSRVYAGTFTAYEGGCTYLVEPGKTYGKNGANEPERERTPSKKSSNSSNPTPQSTVTPPTIKINEDSKVALTNPNSVSGISYQIQYSFDNANFSNYSIPFSVSDGQTVYAKVIATSTDGTKLPATSSVASLAITTVATPTQPTIQISGDGKATLTHANSADGGVAYHVQYKINDTDFKDYNDSFSVSDGQIVYAKVIATSADGTQLHSTSAVATLTISSVATPTQPTIKINGDGTATLTHANSADGGVAYHVQYKIDGNDFKNYDTPFGVSDGQTVSAKVIATSTDGTKLPATSSVESMTVTKMPTPAISLSGSLLKFTYASGYECVLTVDGTDPSAPTSSQIDLSSHLGKKISFAVTAKEANKINSETATWENTQLETPNVTGTTATYDKSSKKLSVAFSIALSTDRDYEFIITKDGETTPTKTITATISGTSLEATLDGENVLVGASYTVKVRAIAKDVSKYNSIESSDLSFTVPTL